MYALACQRDGVHAGTGTDVYLSGSTNITLRLVFVSRRKSRLLTVAKHKPVSVLRGPENKSNACFFLNPSDERGSQIPAKTLTYCTHFAWSYLLEPAHLLSLYASSRSCVITIERSNVANISFAF